MNPKIQKLREEREKNRARITTLQNRNKHLDEQITELENTEILGMVRATGMDLNQLAACLEAFRSGEAPFSNLEKEEEPNEA